MATRARWEEKDMSDQRIISRRTLLKSGAATAAGVAAVAAFPTVGMAQSASAPAGANGSYTPPAADTTATLTISNWGDPNDQAVYAGAAERFKAKYPNVTVNDNFVPIAGWAEYI